MFGINLLPWREQKRAHDKKQFVIYLVGGAVSAMIVVFLWGYLMTFLIKSQWQDHQRLAAAVGLAEQQMKEHKAVKSWLHTLKARMDLLQNLHSHRNVVVRLLDELINIMPDGIYLNRVEFKEDKVTLVGYASSTTAISYLMRNIDKNAWIQAPLLTEIKKSPESQLLMDNIFKVSFSPKANMIFGNT